jgi:hypothetical protein
LFGEVDYELRSIAVILKAFFGIAIEVVSVFPIRTRIRVKTVRLDELASFGE